MLVVDADKAIVGTASTPASSRSGEIVTVGSLEASDWGTPSVTTCRVISRLLHDDSRRPGSENHHVARTSTLCHREGVRHLMTTDPEACDRTERTGSDW